MTLKNVKRIFVLGDLHLGVRNNSIEWSKIQHDFLVDFFLKKIDEEGFDPETDILIQLGDWHHVRESTNVRILDLSLRIANEFNKKFKRGVYVILGNHDVYYKDRVDVHSLLGFNDIFKNFNVFTEPTGLIVNQHKLLLLPWIESLEVLKNKVNENKSKYDYLFCHADIKGVSLTKSATLDHGLEADDLHGYKKIYSGHIHIRQESKNFIYTGTPYEMDRGDSGNIKGFYVLDVTGDKITHKFVENTVSPKYLRLEMYDLLNMKPSQIKRLFNNNFIDINIESSLSKKVQFSTFTDKVKDFGHRSLEFYPYTHNQTIKKSEIEIGDDYEFNIFSILDHYLDQLSLQHSKRAETYQYFKTLYDKINTQQKYR
jgi:DNA repair exonuclease SbcCD nuclease subunit